MKVVMLSRTPLAGAPLEAMKCLNKYTDLNVRWISIKDNYADKRIFPSDLIWSKDRPLCIHEIKTADIVHIHNEPFPIDISMLSGKRVVVQFHSVPMRKSYNEMCRLSKHAYTIMQPMQQREYIGLPALPNLIDPEEYVPAEHSNIDVSGRPTVVFAPTNKWAAQLKGSKACTDVIRILHEFKRDAVVDIFSDVPYEANLRRKRFSDIVVDDVVGNTFHRTALEGCCFGLAVITSHHASGFFSSDLAQLPGALRTLVKNPTALQKYKQKSRDWVQSNWHPRNLCAMYVEAYKKALK